MRDNNSNHLGSLLVAIFGMVFYRAASDEANHWAIRLFSASVLCAIPAALGFFFTWSSVDQFLTNQHGAWVLLAMGGIPLAFCLGYLGMVAKSCAEHFRNEKGWRVIIAWCVIFSLSAIGLAASGLGWWIAPALPTAFFVTAVVAEALLGGSAADESDLTEHVPLPGDSILMAARFRNWFTLAVVAFAVSFLAAYVGGKIDSSSVIAFSSLGMIISFALCPIFGALWAFRALEVRREQVDGA